MTEKQIESRMVRMVRERGGLSYKFVSPGEAGVPDRLVLLPDGRIIFVELKTLVGSLQRIQRWQIGRMREKGADVRVLHGWDAIRAFVDEVLPKGSVAQ